MHKFLIPGILVGVGLVVAILGVVIGFVVFPNLIDSQIEETVQLKTDTDTWEDWVLNPVPVYLKFYIFNITNPTFIEDRKGEKPLLQEKGPYVFSQRREKQVSDIDEDSDTITYEQNITYYFEEDLSVDKDGNQLSLGDTVNIVNLPFITFSTALAGMSGLDPLTQLIFEGILREKETFVRQGVTVGEALFDGWKYPDIYNVLLALSMITTGETQVQFEGGRFGYYHGSNQSTAGEYVIRSGLDGISHLGEIVSFNGQPNLEFWANPTNLTHADDFGDERYCNAINGTDGAVFPPFLTKDSEVPIFSADVCRSVSLVFEGEDEHRDIKGYKYAFPESFYEHPEVNHDNYCFCPSPADGLENECAKGLIRLFTCRGGPLVTSSPHFYNGDPKFTEKIDGLTPSKEEHETYLLLQPKGGFPLKLRKRIQMSLEIQNFKNSFHAHFNDIDYIALPALWASEEMELNEEKADQIKNDLLKPMKIVNIVKWVIIAVGVVVAIAGIILFMLRRRRSGHTV